MIHNPERSTFQSRCYDIDDIRFVSMCSYEDEFGLVFLRFEDIRREIKSFITQVICLSFLYKYRNQLQNRIFSCTAMEAPKILYSHIFFIPMKHLLAVKQPIAVRRVSMQKLQLLYYVKAVIAVDEIIIPVRDYF
jgi:hypothetical protein